MRTILLSFLAFATLFLFSSAAPWDKTIDEFTNILGLDLPKPNKKPLSKKGKPPGKPPGPKLFPDASTLGFFSQIPTKFIPKIREDDDQRRKKHFLGTRDYFAPLHEEPKRASPQGASEAQGTRVLTDHQTHVTLRKLEEISAGLPVNLH